MTPELQQELLNLLKDSREFVVTQAPEVFQQALRYGLIANGFDLLLCILLIILFIFLFKKSLKIKDDLNKGFSFAFLSIFIMLTFIGAANSIEILMKIHVAPKVYLMDHFAPIRSGK